MFGRHGSVVGGGGGGGGNNETRALESQLVVTGQEALEDATASRLSIAAGDQCRSGGSSTKASRSGGGGGDGSLRLARRQVSTGLRASTTGCAGRRYAQHGIRRRGGMTARNWCFDASQSHWTRARGGVDLAAAELASLESRKGVAR
jgi:hypothetical protein